jgi:hypothetical protein
MHTSQPMQCKSPASIAMAGGLRLVCRAASSVPIGCFAANCGGYGRVFTDSAGGAGRKAVSAEFEQELRPVKDDAEQLCTMRFALIVGFCCFF